MADVQKSKFAPFWIIVLVLLLILGALVMFGDVLPRGERESDEPQPTSTEWTTKPEEGVEVTLPDTPIRTSEPEGEVPPESEQSEGE